MHIQPMQKHIVNVALVSALALGFGGFNSQPAAAQLSRSAFREMAQELDLSRSQMRNIAGVMRSFKSDVESILTPQQLNVLEAAHEQRQTPTQTPTQTQKPQDLRDALNLTDTQLAQLAVARENVTTALQDVLEPDQVDTIMAMLSFNSL